MSSKKIKYPKMSKAMKGNINGFKKGEKCKNWNGIKKGDKIALNKHWNIKDTSKMSKSHKGKKNPNWKGGIWLSKLKVYTHYKNSEYKTWRERVFRRDNYTCQECRIRGVFLHPHHIKSYTYYPEYRYDIDNGITLCVPCHHQLHFGN